MLSLHVLFKEHSSFSCNSAIESLKLQNHIQIYDIPLLNVCAALCRSVPQVTGEIERQESPPRPIPVVVYTKHLLCREHKGVHHKHKLDNILDSVAEQDLCVCNDIECRWFAAVL